MAIDKKLIHFKTWNNFILQGVGSEENITTPTSGKEDDGTAIYGQIKGTSIVFIKDVGKIWTHGKVYDGSTINVDELQDKLVSGENIKTINGTSILGEGDIEISGYDDTEIKANLEQAGILAYEAAMRSSRNEQNKVDKIDGKGLSTEDFTTALKTKLEGMNSFDPTEINNKVNGLQTQIDTLVNGDASAAIESFNEIINFLNGIEDTESLEGIIAGIERQITNKQDAIADLDTIRSGAALGATALQSYTEQYKGTVTGIKVNGSTHNPSNGVVDLGTISADESLRIHFEPNFDLEIGQHIDVTSLVQQSMGITPAELYEEVVTNGKKTALFIHELMGGELQEISRVIDSLYEGVGLSYLSTLDGLPSPFQLIISTTQCQLVIVDMLAGYNSVVVPLTEMVEGKQEQLVSGTNIKTINGESILGSGNITVSIDSDEFATKTDLVYAVSKSASQGNLTSPGYYYFKNPTTIAFGSVNQYPRGIYSIVIDGFSTEPLGVFYPLNFIWTNGEPDFASFAGTTKVLEISLFVLDDANSSKKVLATWALFNF